MTRSINGLAHDIHQNAIEHGWWDKERELPEILMLCVSELSEALEEYRDGKPLIYCNAHKTNLACRENDDGVAGAFNGDPCLGCLSGKAGKGCRMPKPEGIGVELADTIIRILDYCGHEGIDIDAIIDIKHEYNKSRPYRHSDKKC